MYNYIGNWIVLYYRSEPVDGSMSVPVNSEVCLVARWGAVFFFGGGAGEANSTGYDE